MKLKKLNWSYKEFLAFFLLCAANADHDIKKEEEEFIHNKVGEDIYENIKKVFNDYGDYERIQIIKSYKGKFFNTHEDSKRMFQDMIELFLIDEEYHEMEAIFFMFLKKTLK